MDTEVASALGKEGVSEVISGLGFRVYLKLCRPGFRDLGFTQNRPGGVRFQVQVLKASGLDSRC